MSKYLDEAGVKEMLRLIKGYIDLKLSGNSVSEYPLSYGGSTVNKYMLIINDTYTFGTSTKSEITEEKIKAAISNSSIDAKDYSFMYIAEYGSIFYSLNNTSKETAWISNLTTLLPNLNTIYVKQCFEAAKLTAPNKSQFETFVGSKVKVVWL